MLSNEDLREAYTYGYEHGQEEGYRDGYEDGKRDAEFAYTALTKPRTITASGDTIALYGRYST